MKTSTILGFLLLLGGAGLTYYGVSKVKLGSQSPGTSIRTASICPACMPIARRIV